MQNTKINGKYELILPKHRAEREQWDINNGGWEVVRLDDMVDNIKSTDILFEAGCEEGDLTGVVVKETGCDVVLFEPNERVFPCIKAIWQANKLKDPLDFYKGFLSNKTTNKEHTICTNFDDISIDDMIPDHGFKQLYENYPDVPQITMDDYCELTGIYPTVISIDVEGAEFNLLKGAEKTLKEKRPILYLSVHPEFLYIHYDQWTVQMLRFIDECGYKRFCLEYTWHELHIKAIPI